MRLDHLLSKEFFFALVGLGRGRFVCCPACFGWGRAVLLVGVFSGVFGRGRAWHVIGVLGQRAVWCGFLFPFWWALLGCSGCLVVVGGLGVGGLVVNCIVGASIGAPPCPLVCCWGVGGALLVFAWFLILCVLLCLLVFMGVRWMPWHQGPMKDVVACDKPRGAGLRAVIRGFPNGGTRPGSCPVTRA